MADIVCGWVIATEFFYSIISDDIISLTTEGYLCDQSIVVPSGNMFTVVWNDRRNVGRINLIYRYLNFGIISQNCYSSTFAM